MKKTLILSALAALAGSTFAQTTLVGDNFEAMLLGSNPVGQAPQINNTGTPALWTFFGTAATATVSNLQAAGGAQSIFVDRATTGGAFWLYPPLNFDGTTELDTPWTPAIGAFEASVDVRFATLATNTGAIGFDCYTVGRFARLLVIASGPTTAHIIASFPNVPPATGLGNFIWAGTPDRTGWINLRVRQEMLTGTSSLISFFVNGQPVGDGLFQARYTVTDTAGVAPSDFSVQQTTFGTTTVTTSPFFGLAFPTVDDDYFVDNFRVTTEGPVQQITIPLNLQGTMSPFAVNRVMRYRLLDAANNPIHGWYGFTASASPATIVASVPAPFTGTVTVEVDGAQFLRRRIPVVMTGGNQTIAEQTVFNGDVDNNGEVDLTDIDLIIAAYLTAGGTTEGTITDLDNNGEVDLTDIDIAIGNYLLADD